MTYWLIDSPVTVFSDKADIEKWFKELDRMPESEQRDLAIKDATETLEYMIARENRAKHSKSEIVLPFGRENNPVFRHS